MDLPIINLNAKKTTGISLTAVAAEKVRELLAQRGTPDIALRIGVRGGGCSGNSYFMEFCEQEGQDDGGYVSHDVRLVVDSKSMMLLAGTEIDFVSGLMGSGFKCNDPNVRHNCSCGESFSV
ncbi:MAG: iron-sulfur cluster assembly accessory protein [Candidatus Eisenbacteria bacterium]|nr:iron-sulfur cluster assembly accessory protein [Candidatus Eisenbacteria bacterium]